MLESEIAKKYYSRTLHTEIAQNSINFPQVFYRK